jgi:PQQ-dependent dehydrogenase (methanol/ethanol family)
LLCVGAGLAASGCRGTNTENRFSTAAAASSVPQGSTLVPPKEPATDDGEWRMAARNYANTRFSRLNEINTGNASRLRVSWTFATGTLAGHEAAPLIVDNTMFLVSPFPNIVYALDLGQPGAPLKWQFDPKPPSAARGVACCDVVNRGAAYWEGSIIFNTLDGRTIALDANTGQPRWATQLGDINRGETITMAPIVAEGKVLVGNSGGEFGVRGWLTALNAGDGSIAWRAYSTGPDKDVLIGPEFKPFYEQDRGKDLGVSTWQPEGWRTGGGTVWGWVSYDPELRLVYYGTANPGPWNPDQRPGDNKWTAGIFARDVDTGAARWFYQWSPHDLYDHDGINENILLDATIEGRPRKILVHPGRNGFVYVLDRTNGQVLSATPFVHNTAARGVDLQTGRLVEVPEKKPSTGIVVRDICPAAPARRTGSPPPFPPTPTLSTCRTTTCAWTSRRWRPATSPARPTWARQSCTSRDRAATRERSRPGIRSQDARSGRSRRSTRPGAGRWQLPAASCSTARWRAGSRPSMRDRAMSCGSSRPARESSDSR